MSDTLIGPAGRLTLESDLPSHRSAPPRTEAGSAETVARMPSPGLPSQKAPVLSVIIPTYNEHGNVAALVASLEAALPSGEWEVIFVDDNSPDGTSRVARSIAENNTRVRCIRRIGRRGLSSAVIEGMLSSSSQYVAVMDGDMQHDESLLSRMLDTVSSGQADLAIASRYIGGGDAGGLANGQRHKISQLGTWAAQRFLGVDVRDPMSGFFLMSRTVFESIADSLSGEGFKILLDVLVSMPKPVRVVEVPMVFRQRHSGESKLDMSVIVGFARMLIDKSVGHYIPTEFILFSMVGASGVLIHMIALHLALTTGFVFETAQIIASFAAMTSNFWINNRITFGNRRLRGLHFFVGLVSFYLICAFGLASNIGVAHMLFARHHYSWWFSGVAGAVASAVWNYAASSFITWGRRK